MQDFKITKEELNYFRDKKIQLVPGELRDADNPNEAGMPICVILMDGKKLTDISGETHQNVADKVTMYLRENVLKTSVEDKSEIKSL